MCFKLASVNDSMLYDLLYFFSVTGLIWMVTSCYKMRLGCDTGDLVVFLLLNQHLITLMLHLSGAISVFLDGQHWRHLTISRMIA